MRYFLISLFMLAASLPSRADTTDYAGELKEAKVMLGKGEIAKSLYIAKQMVEQLNAQSGNKAQKDYYLVEAYNIAGTVYYQLEAYTQSFYYHRLAMGLALKNHSDRQLAATYRLISIVYYKERDYDRVTLYLRKALAINLKYGVRQEIIKNYNNLGLVYFDRSDNKTALYYMNRAMQFIDKNDLLSCSLVLTNISQIYFSQGDYASSLNILRQAMQLQSGIAFAPDMLQTQLNTVSALLKLGRKDEARMMLKNVDRRVAKLHVPSVKSNSLQYMADMSFVMKDSLQGLRYLLAYYKLDENQRSQNNQTSQLIKVFDMEQLQQRNLQLSQQLKIVNLKEQKRKLLLGGGLFIFAVVAVLLVFILRQSERLRRYQKEEYRNHEQTMTEEIDYRNRQLTSVTMEQASVNLLHTKILDNVKLLQDEIKVPSAEVSETINTIRQDISHYNNQILGQDFRIYFDQVHPKFLSSLLETYPQLSKNDLHICAYIHLGMSTKEIAALTFREVKSVDSARNRLRRKLDLSPDVSIQQFLNDFNKKITMQ